MCSANAPSLVIIEGTTDKKKAQRIRKTTGIPKTFLKHIDDPNMTGAMVTSSGTYAIPTINARAYAEEKKSVEPAPAKKEKTPEKLVCPLCKDTMSDAATIPCCGHNFCDECIRTALLESEDHQCPVCYQTEVSPDTIEANKRLRQLIENCDNSQIWSCLPTSDTAQSTSAQKAELSPLPPAPAPRLDTAKSDPPSKMHAMEQDPYARALASFYSPGHPHHSYRLEAHQKNNQRERRDDHRGSNSRFPSPGHRRSRDRHESHWKRHHKEEQEHWRSHSRRRHHHSRDRSPSHHKRDHREEKSYRSRSRLPLFSHGPYSQRDRLPYR